MNPLTVAAQSYAATPDLALFTPSGGKAVIYLGRVEHDKGRRWLVLDEYQGPNGPTRLDLSLAAFVATSVSDEFVKGLLTIYGK